MSDLEQSASDVVTEDGEVVFSVSEINRLSNSTLESQFSRVIVEGELHQLSRPASGHWYFTIKDSSAQLSCVMYKSAAQAMTAPNQGESLRLYGRLGIYQARGNYQMVVQRMSLIGEGQLWQRFEQLKQKLQAEGLFEESAKQAVPAPPRHIAIITSPSGAVVHDVMSVLGRRAPHTPKTLLPTAVQGDQAIDAICESIAKANESGLFDVILLCRGGGSLEDLWSFNEERVVRAVAESALPVISAVGHESDYTLCDFVADLRAPTPSVAAEILSSVQETWPGRLAEIQERMYSTTLRLIRDEYSRNTRMWESLSRFGTRMGQDLAQATDLAEANQARAMRDMLRDLANQVQQLKARLQDPRAQYEAQAQKLTMLKERLVNAVDNAKLTQRLEHAEQLLVKSSRIPLNKLDMKYQTVARRFVLAEAAYANQTEQRLNAALNSLNAMDPTAVLQRGYAIVKDADGKVVRSIEQVRVGDSVKAQLSDGEVVATAVSVVGPPLSRE